MENPLYTGAGEAAELIARGEVTALELTDAAISRIAALDSLVNAVVVPDFDRARAMAKRADEAVRQGHRLPLLGVPITVKESFPVAGLPTSWGIPEFRDWRPTSEALAVQRLRRAGAIILGKTNVSEGLADWQCTNRVFGRTNNPWDVRRTPGGSSGGSAAALAAGFSFLELGSDSAGSIRIPAHFCGVFGHRPTYGLISSQGYNFPKTYAPSDLSTVGPMARTAADLMLALDQLAGPGGLESRAYRLELPNARHKRLADFRCLVLDEHPLVRSSSDVVTPIRRVEGFLRKQGVTVATSSPLLPDLADVARLCVRLLVPMTLYRVSEQHYQAVVERAGGLSPDDDSLTATSLRAGVGSHRDWLRANEGRARLALLWQRLFREWDVIICPVSPTVAFPHDDRPPEDRTLEVDGVSIAYSDQIAWSTLAIPCGLPATAVPAGSTERGLPVGFQIVGPAFEDRSTIALAAMIEAEMGGFTRPISIANRQ